MPDKKVSKTEWGPPLSPWMIEAMKLQGFESMTPVQAATIPLLSGNKDVVVEAITGSGKTLAFVLPALLRIDRSPPLGLGETNVIVLSPTRELASQIFKVFKSVIDLAPDQKHYRIQLVTGGNTSSITADAKTYLTRRPHIVVATAGRLQELLSTPHVKARAIDLLVLDEADKLLNPESSKTINQILRKLPKQKRVGLYSATINSEIEDIMRTGMRNPSKVSLKSAHATPVNLGLKYVSLSPSQKMPAILSSLQADSFNKAIVYIPTCTSVSYWYQVFSLFLESSMDPNAGESLRPLKLFSIHGKLQQASRNKTLEAFTKHGSRCALLTTDVAARGLDIPDVDLVIQLDAPTDPNMFVHRVGRTARAGRSGNSLIVLNEGLELGYVDFMHVRNVPLLEGAVSTEISGETYLSRLQRWVREDRSRHDLALRSFLSYVRYYSKHTATSIFRIGSLDLAEIAKSFGLLRLPKMPELKVKELKDSGWLVPEFDMDSFAYKDPQQEKSRQSKLLVKPSEEDLATRRKNKERNSIAWSANAERKTGAAKRRDKRLTRAIKKKEAETMNKDDSDSEADADWKEEVQARKKQKQSPGPVFDL